MSEWKKVCSADDVEKDDMRAFRSDKLIICVYNTDKGFFATDGRCTHENVLLSRGMLLGTVVECPLHQGRFDVTSGKALSAPACIDLKTYPIEVRDGEVFFRVTSE